MKKHLLLIGLLLAALSSAPGAHALLVSAGDTRFGPGSFTVDTATGLEWLDLSQTFNRTMDSIKAASGVGGTYHGLRYATAGEVVTLYADAGIADLPFRGIEMYNGITNLTNYLGYGPAPYSYAHDRWVMGITGTGPTDMSGNYVGSYLSTRWNDGDFPGGEYNIASFGGGLGFPSSDELLLKSYSYAPFLGSFLVRDQPSNPVATPEPSTFMLLAVGLAGIAFMRREMKP